MMMDDTPKTAPNGAAADAQPPLELMPLALPGPMTELEHYRLQQ